MMAVAMIPRLVAQDPDHATRDHRTSSFLPALMSPRANHDDRRGLDECICDTRMASASQPQRVLHRPSPHHQATRDAAQIVYEPGMRRPRSRYACYLVPDDCTSRDDRTASRDA